MLNTIAYADLSPVIEGGIGIETFESGQMRGATRRVQTATPERPCMLCSGQLPPAQVTLDQNGDLDDPEYIRGADSETGKANVAALAAGVSASQLDQFVSLVAHPAGIGVPPPLRYIFSTHTLERVDCKTADFCVIESDVAVGDKRMDFIGEHNAPGPTTVRRNTITDWIVGFVDWSIETIENGSPSRH